MCVGCVVRSKAYVGRVSESWGNRRSHVRHRCTLLSSVLHFCKKKLFSKSTEV
uniref:Uncharacterized protein n=1 Tax=Anguilla anguilla TaxID=7936 RepID=A0A0E9TAY3_ANGAN